MVDSLDPSDVARVLPRTSGEASAGESAVMSATMSTTQPYAEESGETDAQASAGGNAVPRTTRAAEDERTADDQRAHDDERAAEEPKVVSSRGNRAPALIAAAEALFFERGYGGTTMEAVTRRAGLSKRAAYLYFENKDALYLEVATRGLAQLRESLEALAVHELGFEEAISAILEVYLDFAATWPGYFRIIFQDATKEMVARAPEALRSRLAAEERACLEVPALVVRRGVEAGMVPPVDPYEAAIVFWGSVTGIYLLSLGGSQTVLPDNRSEIIRRAVWVLYQGFLTLPGGTVAQGSEPRVEAQGERKDERRASGRGPDEPRDEAREGGEL